MRPYLCSCGSLLSAGPITASPKRAQSFKAEEWRAEGRSAGSRVEDRRWCSRLGNSTFKGQAESAAAPHVHFGQAEFTGSVQERQAGDAPRLQTLGVAVHLSEAQAEHPSPITDGRTVPPPAWELLESRSSPAFPVKPREGLNKHLLDP